MKIAADRSLDQTTISSAPSAEVESEGVESEGMVSQVDLARFVAGDREAFNQVFTAYQTDLFYIVRRFFHGAFDQEEALQEVWLKLFRMRDRFDVNRPDMFLPWAKQVARNRCIDLLKERGKWAATPVAEVELHCEPTQWSVLNDSRARAALDAFLSRLDPEQQRFFQLCFVDELSHEEIAEKLDLSVRRSKYLKKKLLAQMLKAKILEGV